MISRIAKIAALFAVFVIVAGISAYLTITLIIKSEDTVIIPNLVGKDVVSALGTLTELELNTKVKGSVYSTEVPKNHVVSQEPEPGAEIKKGRDVRIMLSKGAKTILMPGVIGLSIQKAGIILEENGLFPGKLSRTYSETAGKETVIAQFPSQSAMIRRGGYVDLLVSAGLRQKAYKMADLKGFYLDDAIALIESGNLLLGNIKSSYHENKPRNAIVTQDPLSGHRVTEGTVVHLVINRKPGKKRQKYLYGTTGIGLFRYRLKSGFLKRRIRVRLDCFGVSIDLFNDFVKPGEEIWFLIPKDEDATVFLYEDNKMIITRGFDG